MARHEIVQAPLSTDEYVVGFEGIMYNYFKQCIFKYVLTYVHSCPMSDNVRVV